MEPLSSSAKSNHRTGMGKCVSTSDRFLKKKKKKHITVAPDSAVAPAYANYTGKAVNQAGRPHLYALAPLKRPLSINLEGATDASLSQPCLMNGYQVAYLLISMPATTNQHKKSF